MGWAPGGALFVDRTQLQLTSANSHSCTCNRASVSLVYFTVSDERPAVNVIENGFRLLRFSSKSSTSRILLGIVVCDGRLIF